MNKTTKKEIILGIDPGYGRTGWGVIEKIKNEWAVVAYGCIETSVKDPFVDRLVELYNELQKLIKKYEPARVGIEDLFFAKNVKTAMKVGQARGVIILTCMQAGLIVNEFTPLQVKQALTGYGRAEKSQVEKMVQMILKIKTKINPDDAADALAVAITTGASMTFLDKT
ncbi:MAG TPA: crossover junction endodeoxyribonuclease RuvC [Candidatus Magasanikbacteria bacterium]|nr:crossover junction endodeoxyribonuclease RuvC [Candidatus Magasanikbacteria bacterium]